MFKSSFKPLVMAIGLILPLIPNVSVAQSEKPLFAADTGDCAVTATPPPGYTETRFQFGYNSRDPGGYKSEPLTRGGPAHYNASRSHYLLFQNNGNLVVCSAAGNKVWGLDQAIKQKNGPGSEAWKNATVATFDGKSFSVTGNNGFRWDAPLSNPITSNSAALELTDNGILQLFGKRTTVALTVYWASNGVAGDVYVPHSAGNTGYRPCGSAVNGWDKCLELRESKVLILASEKTSWSDVYAISTVYNELFKKINKNFRPNTMSGFKVHVTYDENGDRLKNLPVVGSIHQDIPENIQLIALPSEDKERQVAIANNDGIVKSVMASRDWLLGGAENNDLWISSQMICNLGVPGRNLIIEKMLKGLTQEQIKEINQDREIRGLPLVEMDHTWRSFDQVIHEMAHSIELRYGLTDENMNVFQDNGPNLSVKDYEDNDNIESFPFEVQHWFSSPELPYPPTEEISDRLGSIFTGNILFKCPL